MRQIVARIDNIRRRALRLRIGQQMLDMRTHAQLRRSKGRTAHTAADSTKTAEIVLMVQHVTAIAVSACFHQ